MIRKLGSLDTVLVMNDFVRVDGYTIVPFTTDHLITNFKEFVKKGDFLFPSTNQRSSLAMQHTTNQAKAWALHGHIVSIANGNMQSFASLVRRNQKQCWTLPWPLLSLLSRHIWALTLLTKLQKDFGTVPLKQWPFSSSIVQASQGTCACSTTQHGRRCTVGSNIGRFAVSN